jgi:hypothetical protein
VLVLQVTFSRFKHHHERYLIDIDIHVIEFSQMEKLDGDDAKLEYKGKRAQVSVAYTMTCSSL